MANSIKNQEDILTKLNIHVLNPMQEEAIAVIETTVNTVILSPTGTGKTLAFALPLVKALDPESNEIQALILAPSRELAIQIEQVIRSMGSGYKVNAVYGGRPMSKDKIELKHNPAILIGTPGRILDHFNADRFSKDSIKTLVLDEFDKSLEDGFEEEMKGIIDQLPNISKRILTSATQGIAIPAFVRLDKPKRINYLKEETVSKLAIKTVISPSKDKLQTLLKLLEHIGNAQGIVFCNYRDSIADVSDFLDEHEISHTCFSGGMEQKDRERAL
jgi:superfamily II DNA/RNA helicase